MSRVLTSAFEVEIDADNLRPALFIKAEFDSGDLLLWSGLGEIVWGGDTYVGAGHLLNISAVQESQKLQASGLLFTLSGMPTSLVSIALTEEYQWRPITMWLAVMNTDYTVIADPYKTFAGKMDVMQISDDGQTSTMSVAAENNLIDLKSSKERRYTNEDQISEYPGDLGLQFMPTNADVQITWGKSS